MSMNSPRQCHLCGRMTDTLKWVPDSYTGGFVWIRINCEIDRDGKVVRATCERCKSKSEDLPGFDSIDRQTINLFMKKRK